VLLVATLVGSGDLLGEVMHHGKLECVSRVLECAKEMY
jgi:hypothetical protein